MVAKRWLADEVAILWDTDPRGLDYVRETWTTAWTRRGPIRWSGRVGYSILAPDAPNAGYPRMFHRRVFWLKPHDRDANSVGTYPAGAPVEAVDPLTVAPGITGRITKRVVGRPGSPMRAR